VVLAARGAREEADGAIRPVGDPVESTQLRERGRKIILRAALFAAAMTALSLFPA
jgi:hypothetical protein